VTDADLARQGAALADGLLAALPGWAERAVARFRPDLAAEGHRAGAEAAAALAPRLRALLAADVDDQRSNPLAIVRTAVAWPAAVLAAAGVPPVERDDFERAHFPDDDYGLTPMTFGDVDPEVHELGIVWGAVKAHTHLQRHKPAAAPVVVFAPDLADRTQIVNALPAATFVSKVAGLTGAATGAIVLVDLTRPGLADVLVEVAAVARRVVGFGPHVALDQFAAPGVELVARSKFFRDPAAYGTADG
jgi:hypothetical protein